MTHAPSERSVLVPADAGLQARRDAYEAQFGPLVEALQTPPPPQTEAERLLIAEVIEQVKRLGRPGG